MLAEGTARTAAHFGHPELGMQVKGQAIAAYDPRGLKEWTRNSHQPAAPATCAPIRPPQSWV